MEREEMEAAIEMALGRRQRMLERRFKALEALLEEAHNHAAIFHEGELLQSHFHLLEPKAISVKVQDWETNTEKVLTLEGKKSPQAEIEARFKKSKKLKKAIPHLEQQVSEKEKELKKCAKELASFRELPELEPLYKRLYPPKKTKSEPRPRAPFHTFYTEAGLKILVGRKAADNDRLSCQIARGNDWWFHAHNYPGSHVVLCVNKGEEPDGKSVEEACQVALHHSQARGKGYGEITVTQVKYVSKPRGAPPGRVTLSKHRVVEIKEDTERYHLIRSRTSPPSLPKG